MLETDFLIVGAGISGLTLAERIATQLRAKVLVIEQRDHIGGNCYDYTNADGILVPKYGPHFFHTNDVSVWRYVSKFTKWHKYEHRVLSSVNGLLVPVPVNINTVNILFGTSIKTESQMKQWLGKHRRKIKHPKNSEQSALGRVGYDLYIKMFKNYTKKQWNLWPHQLDSSIMDRIPVRTNFDDRYFTDTYQAMPKNGYTKLFKNMINHPKIKIKLNTNYYDIKKDVIYKKLFFTGRIDHFFGDKMKKLQYRSLRFEYQTLNMDYFQSRAQINYPNDNEFTRITEPKHATGQLAPVTTIIREYSTWDGEPYYPVINPENLKRYHNYQQAAKKLEKNNIHFVGRLANYKYFNMDEAFKNALNVFKLISN